MENAESKNKIKPKPRTTSDASDKFSNQQKSFLARELVKVSASTIAVACVLESRPDPFIASAVLLTAFFLSILLVMLLAINETNANEKRRMAAIIDIAMIQIPISILSPNVQDKRTIA